MRGRWLVSIMALALVVSLFEGCEPKDDSDSSGGGGSSAAPDCSNGPEAGEFVGDVPSWIQDNFVCVRVTADGDELVIETRALPPYTSFYYGADSDRYDDTIPETPNPNKIEEQSITMTVTANPSIGGGGEAGLGIVGIAADGVVIFNDEAAPGDVLADEVDTFDVNSGHATNSGVYHYHTEPPQLSDDDDAVVGIAIDGFPIFGMRSNGGTQVISNGDNFHDDNDMQEFNNNTPHYHIVYDNDQAQSAEAGSDVVNVTYLIGTNLGGDAGTVEGDTSGM